MAVIGGANEHARAGGMPDGKDGRWAVRQHDLAHEGFEIGVIFREVAHIALERIAQRALGEALSTPVERGDRESPRAQIAYSLEILLDPFAAALKDANGAA